MKDDKELIIFTILGLPMFFHVLTYHYSSAWNDHTKMCVCSKETEDVINRDGFDCNSWCENSVKYNVTNNDRGIVRLSIPHPSAGCLFDSFEIDFDVTEGNNCQNSTGGSLLRHTNRRISVSKNSTECSSCMSNIELDFDYVFTGCYRLRVLPRRGGVSFPSCFSRSFHIVTEHEKSMIRDPKVSIQTLDSSSKIDVLLREGDLSTISQLQVVLENATNGVLVKNCFVPWPEWRQQTQNLRGVMIEDVILTSADPSNCTCDRFNEEVILCSFLNLDVGKYRIRVKAYDTRCRPKTLWRRNCEWFTNETILNHYERDNSVDEVLKDSSFTSFSVIITIVGCLLLFHASLILLYILWKARNSRKTSSKKIHNLSLISSSNNRYMNTVHSQRKVKVVLLYPRDCQPFIDVMDKLRHLLYGFKNIEVIDPLNIDLQEEVEMNINTWGLKLTKDPTVKFILVASRCSLKLEDGLLSNHRYEYFDKRPFDTIFPALLNQLYFEDFPYKKIYVIRLDCDEVEDLCYQHLAKCRNFTLPQCTETLIHHILDLPSETSLCIDDQQDQLPKLVESIRHYNLYLRENPNYLNTLLTNR